MIWNKDFECMNRSSMNDLQLERLKKLVSYVYNNVPHYKKAFDEKNISPDAISNLKDIEKLPFTTKDILRDNYPFNLFAVPMEKIVRIHASSGTTGKPTVVGYTENDIDVWSEVMARSMMACGTDKNSIVQNAYGYGLFTGGLGVHYGSERIGASVIPISGGNTKRQLMILEDFGSTIITCTPSYSLFLCESALEQGIDFKKLPLQSGIFGAEPWSENLRKEIEQKLSIKAYDIYGLSEIIGPGVAIECCEQDGLHIFEDHFYPEIIDPETGKTVEPGVYGELVITTLTKEGIPLIRYRTKDITALMELECPCGRTVRRIKRFSGRTDDMLIIRGVNVFPSQIESVLVNVEEADPHYQLIVSKEGPLDILEVQVEIAEKFFSDEIKKLQLIKEKIAGEIQSALGLTVKVTLVEPKTIQRSEGKAKRVTDLRNS
jgi:phenylacetate-CoA ligase